MYFPREIKEKFPLQYSMDSLPVDDKERDTRMYPTVKSLRTHATLFHRVESILQGGLLPGGESGCTVWGEDRMGIHEGTEKEEIIRQCRLDGIFFWDTYMAGAEQGIATVGFLKDGEPAILVVDVSEHHLEIDPENTDEDDTYESLLEERESGIPQFARARFDPSKILCVCALDDVHQVTTGSVFCPSMHSKEECEFDIEDVDNRMEFYEPSSYQCRCKLEIDKYFEGEDAR